MVYLGFSPGPEYIPIFFNKPNIWGIFNNTRTFYILRVILCYDKYKYMYIHFTCCNNMHTNVYIFCIVRHDTDSRLNTAYCINNVLLFILVKTIQPTITIYNIDIYSKTRIYRSPRDQRKLDASTVQGF